MIKKNPYEQNIQKKCHVCKNQVAIDQFGNGDGCSVCGWQQNDKGWEFPDRVIAPNLTTLNKAISRYSTGRPNEVDFDDFIGAYMFYAEMEFWYNNIKYAVSWNDKQAAVALFNEKTRMSTYYKDILDFAANASIDGRKLVDIWHEVKDPYWLT